MATAKNSGSTLTRSDLVGQIAGSSGLPQSQVEEVVRAYESAIKDALAQGNEVRLSDLGKFSVGHSAARAGRNPATGEAMTIAASSKPRFTAGKAFKDLVNASGKKSGGKGAAKASGAKAAAKPAAKAAPKAAAKPAAKPAAKAAAKPAAKPAAKAAPKAAAKPAAKAAPKAAAKPAAKAAAKPAAKGKGKK